MYRKKEREKATLGNLFAAVQDLSLRLPETDTKEVVIYIYIEERKSEIYRNYRMKVSLLLSTITTHFRLFVISINAC